MGSYLDARKKAFLRELEYDRYGSDVTFKGRTFRVVATSKAKQKEMTPVSYLAKKTATLDFPVETSILPKTGVTVPGFDADRMVLRETINAEGIDYEITQIQDDQKEPFVRVTCERKQNQSTAI